MLVHGMIPDIMTSTILTTILAGAKDKLFPNIALGHLYRCDVSHLGLTDERLPGSDDGSGNMIDVIRKMNISPSAVAAKRIRRCARCRSVAEELEIPPGQVGTTWLMQAMRQCVCANSWIIHEEDEGTRTL